jgi:serine/threonine-protein kinase HipA
MHGRDHWWCDRPGDRRLMTRCPGCFKPDQDSFCKKCHNTLFGPGRKRIPSVLPFTRPVYDQEKLAFTADRLSISGVQTKISLALVDGQLRMVKSGGQYILKPIPHGVFKRLEIAPVNEHLTMQIARQVFKIATADNALVSFQDGEYAYLVRRFDVQSDGRKSLQEDFAQIAERSPESHGANFKYDFSYEAIGELIRQHVATYPVNLERFFTLVVFNYLVNNGDAHAKNFSLIRDDATGQYNLTPAYDLLNTRLHLPDETRTALDLFKDEFETDSFKANAFYAYDDFAELAKRLGLVQTRFKRILEAFIVKKHEVDAMIDSSTLTDECKNLYKEHVHDRLRALSYSKEKLR